MDRQTKSFALKIGVLAVVVLLGWKTISSIDDWANKKLNDAMAREAEVTAQVELRTKQIEEEKREIDADRTQKEAVIRNLQRELQARKTERDRERAEHARLVEDIENQPIAKVAVDWAALIKVPQIEIQPFDVGEKPYMKVEETASQKTLVMLSEVSLLRSETDSLLIDVVSLQQESDRKGDIIIGLDRKVELSEETLILIQEQHEAESDVFRARITKEKTAALKGKRNWFLTGVVTGAVIVAAVIN